MTVPMVKKLGQCLGGMLGSCFSPTWILLPMVIKPYFNLDRASQSITSLLAEMAHYTAILNANPTDVFVHLIPSLLAVLAIGLGYIWCISWLVGVLTEAAYTHFVGCNNVENQG